MGEILVHTIQLSSGKNLWPSYKTQMIEMMVIICYCYGVILFDNYQLHLFYYCADYYYSIIMYCIY